MTLDYPAWHAAHSRHRGSSPKKSEPSTPLTLCPDCYSEFGRGLSHHCKSKREKRSNIRAIIQSNSPSTVSSVAASTLKEIVSDQGVSSREATVSLLSGGPNKLPVKIAMKVSHDQLMEMQRTLNCSDKKMLELNRCLGVILGQKNLEPYMATTLTSRNKKLEDLFTIQDLNFIFKEKVKNVEVE